MEIILSLILPYWLNLPENEYKIKFYNKRTNNKESYRISLKNNVWHVNSMNQHGELLRDLFLSERYVIDDSTLKLKVNYDELFNQIYQRNYTDDDVYFPTKLKTYLVIKHFYIESDFPNNETEQKSYLKDTIKLELLPIINKFLDSYRFHIGADDFSKLTPFKNSYRTSNIHKISFYDLNHSNVRILVKKDKNEKIDFTYKLFTKIFESEVPSFSSSSLAIRNFKDNLKSTKISIINELWCDLKHFYLKNNWRMAFITADIIIETVKSELNRKTIKRYSNSLNEFNNEEKIFLELVKKNLVEKREHGVGYFLSKQIPLFYKDIITSTELKLLNRIHHIRNNIIHNEMRNKPEDIEQVFELFNKFFKKIYAILYTDILEEKLIQNPTGMVISLSPDQADEAKIKTFAYITERRLLTLNQLTFSLINHLILQTIDLNPDFIPLLENFSESQKIKIGFSSNNIQVHLPHTSLDIELFKNLFNLINEKIQEEGITFETIHYNVYGFIFPESFRLRLQSLLGEIMMGLNAYELVFIETCPVEFNSMEWGLISNDESFINMLNEIAIKFMRRRIFPLALNLLSYAEKIAHHYLFEELEGRTKFNISCCYSRIRDLESSKNYFLSAIRLYPSLIDDLETDEDLEFLRNSEAITLFHLVYEGYNYFH